MTRDLDYECGAKKSRRSRWEVKLTEPFFIRWLARGCYLSIYSFRPYSSGSIGNGLGSTRQDLGTKTLANT